MPGKFKFPKRDKAKWKGGGQKEEEEFCKAVQEKCGKADILLRTRKGKRACT